jgi:hypothetical protein
MATTAVLTVDAPGLSAIRAVSGTSGDECLSEWREKGWAISATVAAVPRKPRRKTTGTRGLRAGRLPGPKRRLSGTFQVLRDTARAGDAALSEAVPADDHLARFDRGVLLRGVNALKSARLLLEEMHWEFAAGPARQLFELLVNLEHLNAETSREQAAFRFTKFGLLQTLRAQLEEANYEQATGRPVDEARVTVIQGLLDSSFDEFRVGDQGRLARSWSGKSTRDLALASPVQPLRSRQYQLLFVAWSEQVHAAPASLMDAFFPRSLDKIDEMIAEDDKRVAETGAMCVTLFVELWRQLRTVPALDVSHVVRWQTRLAAEAQSLGASGPEPTQSHPR